MAKGIHLFPYRTQKLSLSAPMVLGWRRPGRVGRCRIPWKKDSPLTGWVLFLFRLQRPYALVEFDEVRERTWLGFFLPPAVRDAGRKNHLGEQGGKAQKNVFHFVCNVLKLQSSSMKSENVLGSVQPCAPPVEETFLPHLTCAADGVMIGIF